MNFNSHRIRFWLTVISVTIFIIVVPFSIYRYLNTSKFLNPTNPTIIPDKPYNELTDGGMQVRINMSNNLFQVGLLITAGLMGLLIAKDGEARFLLAEGPELTMFICATLLLVLSFVFHALYLTEVSYIYSLAGKLFTASRPSVPDILDPNIDFLLRYQFRYLISGLVLASFTFLSAHKFREVRR